MKKILVVDDEKPISDIIKFNLTKEGYDVHTAYDGEEALKQVEEVSPDLIILDLMLPKIDGLEVAREVRKTHDMPIIMVTAKDAEIDKVLGLEMGADDYVTKPFSNRELVARVKANLRRQAAVANATPEEEKSSDIEIGSLTIHPEAYVVSKNGEKIMHVATPRRARAISEPIARAISRPLNHFTIPRLTVIPAISHPQPKIINPDAASFADAGIPR